MQIHSLKTLKNRRTTLVAGVIGLWLGIVGGAMAQESSPSYPSKPIRWIVPFAAGGVADILARTVGMKLSESLGQPVVIDNRPSAGGIVGTELAARAAPDGYTIASGGTATHAVNGSTYRALPYDAAKDFVPIAALGITPNLLAVHPASPARTVADLIALAKKQPGKLSFGSAGSGSSQRLTAELFKSAAKIEIVDVPYKGSPPAMADLIGGHIDLMFDGIPNVLPLVRSGKLKALAVTSTKRSAAAPEIPTMAEQGLPGFDVASWQGVFAPAQTPKPIVVKLHQEIVRILLLPDVQRKTQELGLEPLQKTPDEFAAMIAAETRKWAGVVSAAGIKAE